MGAVSLTYFRSAAEFGRWLRRHHASSRELYVGFYKTHRGRGLTYPEALDEALAYGWIDGVRKRIDEDRYSIRFTPRRPRSIWSAVNIRRVRELSAQGRMKPPGLHAFRARDETRTRQYSYEREHAAFDPALRAALRANRKAASFFSAQPPGYRKIATFWVMSAKRDETRTRRFAHLIERSASGARITLLSPAPKSRGGRGGK